jgi:hypothetical protein
MGLLYGRAGRLTTQNGGFRRGQDFPQGDLANALDGRWRLQLAEHSDEITEALFSELLEDAAHEMEGLEQQRLGQRGPQLESAAARVDWSRYYARAEILEAQEEAILCKYQSAPARGG